MKVNLLNKICSYDLLQFIKGNYIIHIQNQEELDAFVNDMKIAMKDMKLQGKEDIDDMFQDVSYTEHNLSYPYYFFNGNKIVIEPSPEVILTYLEEIQDKDASVVDYSNVNLFTKSQNDLELENHDMVKITKDLFVTKDLYDFFSGNYMIHIKNQEELTSLKEDIKNFYEAHGISEEEVSDGYEFFDTYNAQKPYYLRYGTEIISTSLDDFALAKLTSGLIREYNDISLKVLKDGIKGLKNISDVKEFLSKAEEAYYGMSKEDQEKYADFINQMIGMREYFKLCEQVQQQYNEMIENEKDDAYEY